MATTARWFNDIEHNDFTRRMKEVGELWAQNSFNPGLAGLQAELAYYRAFDAPTTTPFLRVLLRNQINSLRSQIARDEHDAVERGAMAVEECSELSRENWSHVTEMMDRAEQLGASYNIANDTIEYNQPVTTKGYAQGYDSGSPYGAWQSVSGSKTSQMSGIFPEDWGGMFRIPGRVNDVSRWATPDKYVYSPSEAPGQYEEEQFLPSAWVKNYVTANTLRPISAQDSLSGMELATLQEMQGVLKEGGPEAIKSVDKYMDVAGNFPTHWQDYLQMSLENIPRFQGARGSWYAPIQR
jgi:hypothetical protein